MSFKLPLHAASPLFAALLMALTGCQSSETDAPTDIVVTSCPEVACEEDLICDETGTCIEPECASDSDCNDSTLACREGMCVSKCEGVTCEEGETCDPTSGGCIGDVSCESQDDCADGLTCENETCVLGRLGDCADGTPCADGLTCVNGPVSLCVGACESVTDCDAVEFCVDTVNVPIAPFASYIGYCFPNLCQPGGDEFGVAQDSDYLGPCSDRAGDEQAGICMPGFISGAPVDICVAANGPLVNGDPCVSLAGWGSDQLCGEGTMCLEPVFGGTCSAICDVFDDTTCENTEYFGGNNENACAPFAGSAGFCIPALGAADGGQSCDPTAGDLGAICEDNYGCGPGNLEQTEFSCNPWCDPTTSGVTATYCGDEEYCWTDPNGREDIGICAPTACTSAVQCSDGEICDNTTGDCVDVLSTGGCLSDADCADGLLCEANTCVLGRNGDCSGPDATCGAGLTCISGGGGAISLCVADCSDNTDCRASEFCGTNSNMSLNSQIGAFFSGFIDHCFPNLCKPDVTSADQDVAYTADYMGSCSDRAGDESAGVCLGPQAIGGICFAANGPLAEGDACNPQANWGDEDLCGAGTFCPIGVENPACLSTCNVLEGDECSASQACGALFAEYGFCLDATDAPGPGASCDPEPGATYPCTDGFACVPLNEEQTEHACQAFCDPEADGSTATYCASSEICFAYNEDYPGIGVCVPTGG